jgi:hypothetical protein
MGLPMRITFNDKDFVFQIINRKLIAQNANELEILLNGDKVELIKDSKMVWTQKDGSKSLDPAFVQALGRSVSLRMRM